MQVAVLLAIIQSDSSRMRTRRTPYMTRQQRFIVLSPMTNSTARCGSRNMHGAGTAQWPQKFAIRCNRGWITL